MKRFETAQGLKIILKASYLIYHIFYLKYLHILLATVLSVTRVSNYEKETNYRTNGT